MRYGRVLRNLLAHSEEIPARLRYLPARSRKIPARSPYLPAPAAKATTKLTLQLRPNIPQLRKKSLIENFL